MTETYFASAARSSEEEIGLLASAVEADEQTILLLVGLPLPAVLLNEQRQIVFSNPAFQRLANEKLGWLGLRLGEALQCSLAQEAPSGCGTSDGCRDCGALDAVLHAQEKRQRAERECRFRSLGENRSVDLRVTTLPIQVSGRAMTSVFLEDYSGTKRREVLERTFFHDLLNTAGGLQGLAQLLSLDGISAEEDFEYRGDLMGLADSLVEEIEHHRKLLMAERGDLTLDLQTIHIGSLMKEVLRNHQRSMVAVGRTLKLASCPEGEFRGDPILVKRILGNLVKNALEATPEGGVVTFWCEDHSAWTQFVVHNQQFLQPSTQRQMFRRSFTTKRGTGHGIGTYSVKLFVEEYMGGRVHFQTNPVEGTRFVVVLPKHLPVPVASRAPLIQLGV